MNNEFNFSYFLLQFLSTDDWRRPKVLLNNLIGRRTVSNLFWGIQYGLLPFFYLFPKLTATDFERAINLLQEKKLIEKQQNDQIRLTTAGKQMQQIIQESIVQFHLSGMGLHTNLETVQQCLNLVIQITSEFSYKNNRYYPLQYTGQVMARSKQWFLKNKSDTLPEQLQAEFTAFLNTIPTEKADIFTNSFIGHNDYGLTDAQFESILDLTPFAWHLQKLTLIADFIRWALNDSKMDHFLCNQIVLPWITPSPLSTSSFRSYQLYLKTKDLQNVATLRHVKLNTVKEHLLEAAMLTTDFPFNLLLPKPISTDLKNYLTTYQVSQWQFDEVLKRDARFSFFEFRLLQIERGQIQYAN
ncbi:hypothetical protein GA840_06345 [Pediococcus ethanolidurans]|uniref:helix-turn-helix domain-containing protein n=1 Tax=Pediococcus ethanolidurans TaxID=319653 RepID=UPI00295402F3|nr:helix-turn-helix domain-containing protein [Pediococcus ethanolidurans]MDV7719469.1 hypothetical protein [Pediococcus ethanolidurans]